MAIPRVNPVEYATVEAYAQIEMGSRHPPAESLSFDRQLNLIIEETGGVEEPLSGLEEWHDADSIPRPVFVKCDQNDERTDVGDLQERSRIAPTIDGKKLHPAWLSVPTYEKEGSFGQTITLPEPPEFTIQVPDRDRPHRPEVSGSTMFNLASVVGELRPRFPVDSYPFQSLLEVFLDELEGAYEDLYIEIGTKDCF